MTVNFLRGLWTVAPHYRPHGKNGSDPYSKPSYRRTFIIIIILLQAGDIESNPGPYTPKFPCMICLKAAKWGQKCLQCDLCNKWYHTNCLGMNSSLYQIYVANESLSWICHECGMPQYWDMSSSLFNHETPSSSSDPNSTGDLSQNEASPRTTPMHQIPTATSTPKRSQNGNRTHSCQNDNLTMVIANCNSVDQRQ